MDISRINGGFRGVDYDAGSKFTRGGISVATVTIVWFDLTRDKIEAEERAEVNAIILNVEYHIFR